MNAQTINSCTCIIYNRKLILQSHKYHRYVLVLKTYVLISYSKVIGRNAVNEVVSTLEDLLNWPTPN